MLHITNGQCAAERIREARVPGDVIAWNDALHEGPVPAWLPLDQLRHVRARYIADQRWGPYADVLVDFERRDATVARFPAHDEVVLWFEHDLYDQLQLLQILDWFSARDRGATRLSLIAIDAYPGVEPFYGLGQLSAEQLRPLLAERRDVTSTELALARDAWAAFRSPDPRTVESVLGRDTAALPFLRAALIRHLQQFPSTGDGLSRTERQILTAVAGGAETPVAVFRFDQANEPAPFMGDVIFWTYLRGLALGNEPLLALSSPSTPPTDRDFAKQTVAITERGRAVLGGHQDRLDLGGIDRWLGGVHLRGRAPRWRWDGQRLVEAPAA